jgi:hypothetical protein
MKTFIVVAMLAVFASLNLAVPLARADWPEGDNVLGLYSANDGTGFAHIGTPSAPVTGPYTIYLVATGMTDPSGVFGWECHVIVPGTVFFTGVVYSGQAINVAVAPDFAVGLASALPVDANGAIVLATLSFFVQGLAGELFLHPTTVPSVPGCMTYALGSDPGIILCFHWARGDQNTPVFGFNTGPLTPPIPIANGTWGLVKGLYRDVTR